MLREDDTTSLRVFRAGFVPPLVDDAVTVTRLDKATSDLLPQEPSFYRHISNDVDDDDSYKFVAQQTPVDNDSLFNSVSFALTGQWTDSLNMLKFHAQCDRLQSNLTIKLLTHVHAAKHSVGSSTQTPKINPSLMS